METDRWGRTPREQFRDDKLPFIVFGLLILCIVGGFVAMEMKIRTDAAICYTDSDRDGLGSNDPSSLRRIRGARWCFNGLSDKQGDCDDHDKSVRPGRKETCDGKDNDCDGTVDQPYLVKQYGQEYLKGPEGSIRVSPDRDRDGYGAQGWANEESRCSEGIIEGVYYVERSDDCDDTDPNVHPRQPETCNGIDEDCDGTHDLRRDCLSKRDLRIWNPPSILPRLSPPEIHEYVAGVPVGGLGDEDTSTRGWSNALEYFAQEVVLAPGESRGSRNGPRLAGYHHLKMAVLSSVRPKDMDTLLKEFLPSIYTSPVRRAALFTWGIRGATAGFPQMKPEYREGYIEIARHMVSYLETFDYEGEKAWLQKEPFEFASSRSGYEHAGPERDWETFCFRRHHKDGVPVSVMLHYARKTLKAFERAHRRSLRKEARR